MPKDGDKKKKKKQQSRRKPRIQLDEDYRHFVASTLADSSISTRSSTDSAHHSKTTSSVMADADIDRPSTSSHTESSTSARSDQQKETNQTDNGATGSSSPDRAASASPEPNCAICLGKLENKSFTDSCFHQFCFDCLVEWSKVKAECPLCKQPFKSIVHNIRSNYDYDQYRIPQPEERVSFPEHIFGPNPGVRFRYRTTVTDHRYAHVADRINREIELRLFQRPSQSSPIPSRRRLHQSVNSEFRSSIYRDRLQLAVREHNTRRRVRDTSPTFFQNNPAQTHRLVPWLNRELNAILLLQLASHQVAFILDLIIDLIKRYPIDSEEFYQHILPYTGRYTRHFMREFMMFARSPYHMAAYDRHCSYEPSNERNHDSDSDSDHQRPESQDDGNDSDVIVGTTSPPEPVSHRIPPSQPTRSDFFSSLRFPSFNFPSSTRSSFGGFGAFSDTFFPTHFPGNFFDQSNMFASNNPTMPQTLFEDAFGNQRIINPNTDPEQGPSTRDTPILQTEPIVCTETDSDSSTSDVEIIDIEKPWNERSPIQLSSAEDSDSDVMITGTTYLNDPVKKEKKKKKKDRPHHENQNDNKCAKRKRGSDSSRDKNDAKRPSVSGSAEVSSRSRSRSISPLRLTIIRSPDYKHKKFMYKKHGEANDMRNSGHIVDGSPSSTDSDSESQHVSITSHRHKSKSKRSSIEIVQFRKKKSKSKKSKKHKKDKKHEDSLDTDNHSESRHHKKHKAHRTPSMVLDKGSRSGHSSSGSHSKHKHKLKKKKKHHKSSSSVRRDKESKAQAVNVGDPNSYKSMLDLCTSDSESDSDIDVETVSHKASEPSVRGESFAEPGVEFVELNAAQAAVIDQELDHINKTLADNDYIKSLMSDGGNGVRKDTECFENNDPNRLVNPDDVLNLKSFKKHPYGHKKSTKNGTSSSVTGNSSRNQCDVVNSISQLTRGHTVNSTDNIQISDISSCTDTDIDRQLPSFLTFSNRSSDTLNSNSAMTNPFDRHQRHIANILSTNSGSQIDKLLTNESSAYESPTSTELPSVRAGDDNNDVIDVDTLDTDEDDSVSNLVAHSHSLPYEPDFSSVMDTETGVVPNAVKSYRTSSSSIKVKDFITSGETSDTRNMMNDATIGTIEPKSSSIYNKNSGANPDTINAYKTSTSSIKIAESELDTIDVVDTAHDNDSTNDANLESDDSGTRTGFQNLDSRNDSEIDVENGYTDMDCSRNDSEIDVENEDSDLECSLVEGHKTFEIDGDSDNEDVHQVSSEIEVDVESDNEVVHQVGKGVDIDVVGCSDDDIVVEDNPDGTVSGVTDSDSHCDDIEVSTSPTAYLKIANQKLNKDQTQVKHGQNSDDSEHDLDTDSEDDGLSDKNCIDESDLMYDENGLRNFRESGESDSDECGLANDSARSSNNTNITSNLNSSNDSPEETEASVPKNVSISTSASSSTVSPTGLNWASQSLYEARSLGMSGSSDSVYQEWQSGTPEHYIIGSPSNVSPSLSPQSGSPVLSPEWWERPIPTHSPNSHDGDFQPED